MIERAGAEFGAFQVALAVSAQVVSYAQIVESVGATGAPARHRRHGGQHSRRAHHHGAIGAAKVHPCCIRVDGIVEMLPI